MHMKATQLEKVKRMQIQESICVSGFLGFKRELQSHNLFKKQRKKLHFSN